MGNDLICLFPLLIGISVINRHIPINQKSISVMQQARVMVNKISNRIYFNKNGNVEYYSFRIQNPNITTEKR